MAYDEELANRVREVLDARDGQTEKNMFGGVAFLIDGNMAVAVSSKGGLMVRIAPEERDQLLSEDGASPMVMSGGETAGWVRVSAEAVASEHDLETWVGRGVARALALPKK